MASRACLVVLVALLALVQTAPVGASGLRGGETADQGASSSAAGGDVATTAAAGVGSSQVYVDAGNTNRVRVEGPTTPGLAWTRQLALPQAGDRVDAEEGYSPLSNQFGKAIVVPAGPVVVVAAENNASGAKGWIGVDKADGSVRWEVNTGFGSGFDRCLSAPAVDSQGRVWLFRESDFGGTAGFDPATGEQRTGQVGSACSRSALMIAGSGQSERLISFSYSRHVMRRARVEKMDVWDISGSQPTRAWQPSTQVSQSQLGYVPFIYNVPAARITGNMGEDRETARPAVATGDSLVVMVGDDDRPIELAEFSLADGALLGRAPLPELSDRDVALDWSDARYTLFQLMVAENTLVFAPTFVNRAPSGILAAGSGPVPFVAAYDLSGRLSGQPRWVEQGRVGDSSVFPGNIGRIMHAPGVVLVQPRRSQGSASFRVSAGAFHAMDLRTGDVRYVLDNETEPRVSGQDFNRWKTESGFNLVDSTGDLYTVRLGAFWQDLEGDLEEGTRSQFVRLNADGEVVWRVTEYRLARALGLGDRLLGWWSDDETSLSDQGFFTPDIAAMGDDGTLYVTYGFGVGDKTRALNLMAIDNSGGLHHPLADEDPVEPVEPEDPVEPQDPVEPVEPTPDPITPEADRCLAAPQRENQFGDVADDSVFCNDIAWMAEQAITTGRADGTYGPGDSVLRGHMAAFLHRYAGEPARPAGAPRFPDVPAGNVFETAIGWLAAEDITTGRPDGTFNPGGEVTRGQMAAFLYRFAGEPPLPPGAPGFPDVPAGNVFEDAISWMAHTGITTGQADGNFDPGGTLNRGQMSAFLSRYDALEDAGAGGEGATPSGDPQVPTDWTLGTGAVQVTLVWTGGEVLSLEVSDPLGGTLTPQQRRVASGGQMDRVDAPDCSAVRETHGINVFWPADRAPVGDFVAQAELVSRCDYHGSFRMQVRVDGELVDSVSGPTDFDTSAEVDARLEFTYGASRGIGVATAPVLHRPH